MKTIYDYHRQPDQLVHWDQRYLIPGIAYKQALAQLRENQPVDEKYLQGISRDADLSVSWARKTRRRFPQAEPEIAKNPSLSIIYAKYILKKPWPLAEPAILTNSYYAFDYAHSVLQRRWPQAEAIIASNPSAAVLYARSLVKGAWPEAEPAIARDPQMAYNYASYVLDGQRFPLGEPAIAQSPSMALDYSQRILKQPWPEAEPTILNAIDTHLPLLYAINVLRRPWPEAESRIAQGAFTSQAYTRRFPERADRIAELMRNHD